MLLPEILRWAVVAAITAAVVRFSAALADRDSDGAPRQYGARAAEWLRKHEPFPGWAARIGARMSAEDAAACEARRLEIVGIWDEHEAARRAVRDHVGLTAAERASEAAEDAVVSLMREVMHAVPRTMDGLRALATWVGDQGGVGAAYDDLLSFFAATVAGFSEVAS